MKNIFFNIIIFINIVPCLFSQPYSSITYEPGTEIMIGTGADVCANDIFINGTYSGGGTICQGALPVTILSFTASMNKRNVVLSWSTGAEVNNSGFEIERSSTPLNPPFRGI